MRIVLSNGLFVAQSSFAEKDTVKQAKFRWHGIPCNWTQRGCKACKAGLGKVWWTDDKAAAARLVDYADDAVRAALSEHVAKVEASRATTFEGDIPKPEGLADDYLPYQKAGIAAAANMRNVLFGDEMGLGKTVQAIGRVNCDAEPTTVLIICPSSLRLNWAREWRKWSIHQGLVPYIAETDEDIPATATCVIVNYDKLLTRAPQWQHVFGRLAKYIKEGITEDDGKNPYTDGNGMLKNRVPLIGQIMARRWKYLITDESHFLKNPKSGRSKLVLGVQAKKGQPGANGIVDNADHFICLTGTPMPNAPIEMWPLLAKLDPATFGDFFKFAKRYCNAHQEKVGRNKWVWDFSGASNLAELQEKLRSTVLIRRLKKDVLTDLPPKRRQIIPLTVNGASKAVERELEAWGEFEDKVATLQARMELAEASGDDNEYVKAASALSDLTSVAFTEMARERHEVAVAKIPAVIEHLQGMFDEGIEKVICFAHHKDVVKALVSEFGEAAVQLTGETPEDERQAAVDRFQSDPSCKLFVGNIMAAGVGITLTAAQHVVFAELDWVPANVTQAEDRAHRIGQKGSVLIQHLVFDGSLDARMVAFIIEKQAIADKALDRQEKLVAPVTPDSKGAPAKASKYPVATPQEKDAAKFAMQLLAGMCDGALRLDEAGFNKLDTAIGHQLAAKPHPFTDGQVFLAKRLATKYRRQLPLDVLASLNILPKQ